jgi:hypothetical protein
LRGSLFGRANARPAKTEAAGRSEQRTMLGVVLGGRRQLVRQGTVGGDGILEDPSHFVLCDLTVLPTSIRARVACNGSRSIDMDEPYAGSPGSPRVSAECYETAMATKGAQQQPRVRVQGLAVPASDVA